MTKKEARRLEKEKSEKEKIEKERLEKENLEVQSPSISETRKKVEKKKLAEIEEQRYKLRKEKRKQDKLNKIEAYKKSLINPIIKNNLIVWVDKNKNGAVYLGKYGKEDCFEIKRGIFTFSLKIIHKDIVSDAKISSSIELFKLQEKANKILSKNPEFLRKFKSIS